jgi:phosphinothricin acetyltransferase
MELIVRAAERRDLPAIVETYNHYVRHTPATFEVDPVTVDGRAEWFATHAPPGPHRLFVAIDVAGELVGWATSSPFRPRAAYRTTVEASVYARPTCQGQGVGTQLYRRLFEEIRDEDVERIVAGVALPNPASIALHARFGFRHVGTFTRVGRKFGRYWDVAWFERPLRPEASADPPSERS